VTPTNTGQAMIAFRPDMFLGADAYFDRVEAVLGDLRTSESMTDEPIRLPGDRAVDAEEESRRRGVPVPAPLFDQLAELAAGLGVDVPVR
jgi:LDH2 family malate/lactate/ureidoglycolate dehydrogenase